MLQYAKEAEVSVVYATTCLLGMPVELKTFSTTRLNVKTAYSYVVEHTLPGQVSMRFADVPGNGDDPADADDAVENDSDDADEAVGDSASSANKKHEVVDPFQSGAAVATSKFEEDDADAYEEDEHKQAAATAPVRTEANAHPRKRNKKLERMKAASMTTEGGVFPSAGDDKKPIIVTMTVAYAWRPLILLLYSLYEFYCSFEVVRRAPESAAVADESAAAAKEADRVRDDDDEATVHGDDNERHGRRPNKTFLLRPGCPFYATHELRLLSKLRVPKSYPPPFEFPKQFARETHTARIVRERAERTSGAARTKKKGKINWYRVRSFRTAAHAHAVASLVQHKPWTHLSADDAPHMPESLCWRSYVRYFHDLRKIVAFSDYGDATDGVAAAGAGGDVAGTASTSAPPSSAADSHGNDERDSGDASSKNGSVDGDRDDGVRVDNDDQSDESDNDESDSDSDFVAPFADDEHDTFDRDRADAVRARTTHGIGAVIAYTRMSWMLSLTHGISAPEFLKAALMEDRGRAAHEWGERGKGIACPTDLDLLFAQPLRMGAGAKNAEQIAEAESDAAAMTRERLEAAIRARQAVAQEARPFDDMTIDSIAKQSDKMHQRQDDVDARATQTNAVLGRLFATDGIETLPLPAPDSRPSLEPNNMALPAGTSLCQISINTVQKKATLMSDNRVKPNPKPPSPANKNKLKRFMGGDYSTFVDDTDAISKALNPEQQVVFNIASRHADEFLFVKNEHLPVEERTARCARHFDNTPSPRQLHLIQGGPGAGKSHLIRSIADAVERRGLSPLIVAFQALVATNIGGCTVHSVLGLRHTDDAFHQGTATFRLPTKAREHAALTAFRTRVRMDTLCMIILDEVSAINPTLIVHLDLMFREATGINQPFAAIPCFLIGDLYQMPAPSVPSSISAAVNAHCLHAMRVAQFAPAGTAANANQKAKPVASAQATALNKKKKKNPAVAEEAATPAQVQIAQLIGQFYLITLVRNERAKHDKEWAEVIAKMRTGDPAAWPIRDVLLPRLHLHVLTPEKVQARQAIIDAPLLVCTNFSRSAAVHARAHVFAVRHGVPVITWRSPLKVTSINSGALTPHETDYIHANYPATNGLFVRGMEAFIHTTISAERFLVNGSLVKMESLCLARPASKEKAAVQAMDAKPHEVDTAGLFNDFVDIDMEADKDADDDQERVRKARPGERVVLRRPPFTVNAMVALISSAKEAKSALHDCSLHKDVPIIALEATGKRTIQVCLPNRADRVQLEVLDHQIDANLAITTHKAQVCFGGLPLI